MRKTKDFRETIEEHIHLRLKDEEKIVSCIDNNQKGFNLQYQKYGKSNKYIKVTGCLIRKFNYSTIPCVDGFANLTYTSQNIPSVYRLPCFELIDDTPTSMYDLFVSIFKDNKMESVSSAFLSENTETVDFSGKQINSYYRCSEVFFN